VADSEKQLQSLWQFYYIIDDVYLL